MFPGSPGEGPVGRLVQRTHRVIVLCAALSVLGNVPAWAQETKARPAGGPDAARLSALVADLPRGTELRVMLPSSAELIGRLLSAESDRLVLDLETERRRVAYDEVDTLWIRGNAGKKGALIGGVATGLVVGIYASLLSDALCEPVDGCGGAEFGATLLSAGAGFAAGGLVGWLVGSAIPSWHQRYP